MKRALAPTLLQLHKHFILNLTSPIYVLITKHVLRNNIHRKLGNCVVYLWTKLIKLPTYATLRREEVIRMNSHSALFPPLLFFTHMKNHLLVQFSSFPGNQNLQRRLQRANFASIIVICSFSSFSTHLDSRNDAGK